MNIRKLSLTCRNQMVYVGLRMIILQPIAVGPTGSFILRTSYRMSPLPSFVRHQIRPLQSDGGSRYLDDTVLAPLVKVGSIPSPSNVQLTSEQLGN